MGEGSCDCYKLVYYGFAFKPSLELVGGKLLKKSQTIKK